MQARQTTVSGPLWRGRRTFRPTSRCRIAIQREFGARWDSRPGFHAQLISWSANPSSAAAPYAVRCTVRHEKEYHGQTTYAFDHDR